MNKKVKVALIFLATLLVIIFLANLLFRSYILPIKIAGVNTNSMSPAYVLGEVIFFSKSDNYAIDDVIVANIKPGFGAWVTRIIKINEDGTYSSKMDNNPAPHPEEQSIKEEQIIGKVTGKTTSGTYRSISYSIQILLALFITWLIYSKTSKKFK